MLLDRVPRRKALTDWSVFEREMGSSPSAASERWRRAARTSGPRCVLVGPSESDGMHCEVGVGSSPLWRSCCWDQPAMPVATGWLWHATSCLGPPALVHRQADTAGTGMCYVSMATLKRGRTDSKGLEPLLSRHRHRHNLHRPRANVQLCPGAQVCLSAR